jgi:ribosome assembly protein YihI (activator of Der GTPase)
MSDAKLRQILERLKAGKELSTEEIEYIDIESSII